MHNDVLKFRKCATPSFESLKVAARSLYIGGSSVILNDTNPSHTSDFLDKPTISEVQDTLRKIEETAIERIIKHCLTAAACAVVAIFAVQCTDRYWNETDFVKAVAKCDVSTTLTVNQPGPDAKIALDSKDVVLAAMQTKNECVKSVLEFYQSTATMRPVITIDKDDVVH